MHTSMQKDAEMQAPRREQLFLKTCFGFANDPYRYCADECGGDGFGTYGYGEDADVWT